MFGGTFLTPRNLWILLVQTSSIAVMTTGMVLIIVMRQIDLSVGSILGVTAVSIATMQVFWLGPLLGVGHPLIWIVTLILGIAIGAGIGAFHGVLIAYAGIPSFIVTLGGLIVWRGAAWWVIRGETVAPMDKNFKLIGGGISGITPGAIGWTWSWILGLVACAAIVAGILSGRRQRRRFNFPLRPMWAEYFLGGVGCALALGVTWLVNSYYWPKGRRRSLRRRNRGRSAAGGAQHLLRLCRPRADRARRRAGHDLPGDAHRASAATSTRRAAIRKQQNSPASTPSV